MRFLETFLKTFRELLWNFGEIGSLRRRRRLRTSIKQRTDLRQLASTRPVCFAAGKKELCSKKWKVCTTLAGCSAPFLSSLGTDGRGIRRIIKLRRSLPPRFFPSSFFPSSLPEKEKQHKSAARPSSPPPRKWFFSMPTVDSRLSREF